MRAFSLAQGPGSYLFADRRRVHTHIAAELSELQPLGLKTGLDRILNQPRGRRSAA